MTTTLTAANRWFYTGTESSVNPLSSNSDSKHAETKQPLRIASLPSTNRNASLPGTNRNASLSGTGRNAMNANHKPPMWQPARPHQRNIRPTSKPTVPNGRTTRKPTTASSNLRNSMPTSAHTSIHHARADPHVHPPGHRYRPFWESLPSFCCY